MNAEAGLFCAVLVVLAFALGRYGRLRVWPLPAKLPRARQGAARVHVPDAYWGQMLAYVEADDVESLLQLLKDDVDTLEVQFSIAAYYRSKGWVDKSIKIHQQIYHRTDLEPIIYQRAGYEWAMDFVLSGLYDRAESLLYQVAQQVGAYQIKALQQLLDIYAIEKEWCKAIAITEQLQRIHQPVSAVTRGNFLAELAMQCLQQGQLAQAKRWLRQAEQAAWLRCARLCDVKAAVAEQDGRVEYAIAVLQQGIGAYPEFEEYLLQRVARLMMLFEGEAALQAYCKQRVQLGSETALRRLLTMALHLDRYEVGRLLQGLYRVKHPATLIALLQLPLYQHDDHPVDPLVLQYLHSKVAQFHAYLCDQCGYETQLFEWQCPKCNSWESLKDSTASDQRVVLCQGILKRAADWLRRGLAV